MAILEHPDMPKTIMDIQGLNPWNILLAVVIMAWLSNRGREGLTWDMPRHINVLLVLYLLVVLISFFRMIVDRGGLIEFASLMGEHVPSTTGLWSEHLINCLKWVIPGLLLFDGCRSHDRFILAVMALLGVYFLLGIQVIKWMPLSGIGGGAALKERSLKILGGEIGYHRVNLSMMLAGASLAIFSAKALGNSKIHTNIIIAASLSVFFAQALTGGRMGYVTWAAVCFVLCFLKWRRYLLFAPILIITILWLVPGAKERMLQGFTPETRDFNPRIEQPMIYNGEVDIYTVTAGRVIAWPYVIKKIGEAPVFGYGRLAMQRSGVTSFLWTEFREQFPHPHNAYLQLLLDNGFFGGLPVLMFYLIIIKHGVSLFRDSRDSVFTAIGGITLSLVLALMVASFGSQSFYPREGAVGMWCAIGLMLRVYVQRSKAYTAELQDKTMSVKPDSLWEKAG